jgi:NAD+ diphosphatase
MRLANFYASAGIDRAGHRRKDAAWLAERLAHARSRFLPVWRTQNLVHAVEGAAPRAAE